MRAPMRDSRIINTDVYPLFRKNPARSRQTLIMPEVRRNGKGGTRMGSGSVSVSAQRQRQERKSRPERSWHPYGLQYEGMKPCVCNGSNANCRYCSGSGYVPDGEHPPKGIRQNPYIDMKPSTPPPLDPKIENEIVRGILAREAERNRLEARREERRKRTLVVAVLLFVILTRQVPK